MRTLHAPLTDGSEESKAAAELLGLSTAQVCSAHAGCARRPHAPHAHHAPTTMHCMHTPHAPHTHRMRTTCTLHVQVHQLCEAAAYLPDVSLRFGTLTELLRYFGSRRFAPPTTTGGSASEVEADPVGAADRRTALAALWQEALGALPGAASSCEVARGRGRSRAAALRTASSIAARSPAWLGSGSGSGSGSGIGIG